MSVLPLVQRMLSVEMQEKQQRLLTLNDLGVGYGAVQGLCGGNFARCSSVSNSPKSGKCAGAAQIGRLFPDGLDEVAFCEMHLTIAWRPNNLNTNRRHTLDSNGTVHSFAGRFKSADALNRHQYLAHSAVELSSPFRCRHCTAGTTTEYGMRRHTERRHLEIARLPDSIVFYRPGTAIGIFDIAQERCKLRHVALNRVPNFLETHYIDVRVLPEDQKVSGTSTGLAVFAATCSLAFGQSLRMDTTMRGVINNQPNVGDLDGVGAIRKKVKGARSAGMKRIILPATSCELTRARLPPSVREGIEIEEVRTCEEVVND
ncbi:hypothetical protein niasHS_008948 [Heterodera schachtii]|uniref:Lon proteolytic domain-containing protein n=1 Tax=Heterodera schachtii TaxID=97005 RepID=A0ABD2JDM9_HETSC